MIYEKTFTYFWNTAVILLTAKNSFRWDQQGKMSKEVWFKEKICAIISHS